jgi:hypothetical protein
MGLRAGTRAQNVYELKCWEVDLMAGGPIQKEPSERIRRNRPDLMTVLTVDGVIRGPQLPEPAMAIANPRMVASMADITS